MSRYPRTEIPAGFALREYAEQPRWQAYRVADPEEHSPRYTRRLKAITWCWLLLAREQRTTTPKESPHG